MPVQAYISPDPRYPRERQAKGQTFPRKRVWPNVGKGRSQIFNLIISIERPYFVTISLEASMYFLQAVSFCSGAQIASEVWGGRIVKIRIQAFFARKREKNFLTFFIHIPGNN